MDNKLRKSGIVRSFGITDYDFVQGDTYAYIPYFNEAEKNGTRLKIVPEGDEDRDGPGLPTDEDLIGGGITTSTISLGNPDIAFAKLNNVFREAGHNNFQKNIISVSEGGFIKSLSYTRVIELDIRVNNSYNDWHVAHTGSSNDNNCGLNGNGMFSDCLNDIVSFHNTYNNHDPIMIYLDVKSDWTSTNGRSASDLDALLIQILGISNIYKPSDLRGSNASSSTV